MTSEPAPIPARKPTKRQVLVAELITLLVIAYAVFNLISISMMSEYLFFEGIYVFALAYVVPFVIVILVYYLYLRRMFKYKLNPMGHMKRLMNFARHEKNTEVFFPDGVEAWEITPELRPKLAEVQGDFIIGSESETLPIIKDYIVVRKPALLGSCGDVITMNLLEAGRYPDIIIIDGKTCREKVEIDLPSTYKRVQVSNPAGQISRQAWFAIRDGLLSMKKTIIEVVDGEEDLLVIALALLSPNGSIVAYGQPPVTDAEKQVPSGAVMVNVTAERRKHFKKILSKFKKIPS